MNKRIFIYSYYIFISLIRKVHLYQISQKFLKDDTCNLNITSEKVLDSLSHISKSACAMKCGQLIDCVTIGYRYSDRTCILYYSKCAAIAGDAKVADTKYWIRQQCFLAGMNYGFTAMNSYSAYKTIFTYTKNEISLSLRTNQPNGIVLYVENMYSKTDDIRKDFLGVAVVNGYLKFSIITHAKYSMATATSATAIKDNRWYKCVFRHVGDAVVLCVDGQCESRHTPRNKFTGKLDLTQVLYVGGVPSQLITAVQTNLDITSGFAGCIADLKVNGQALTASLKYNTRECYNCL